MCHYTVHKFLLAFHFPFPNALPMTRIKMVMTMMTGLKDFTTLEFIVWPPSSPWERESEWGDLIVPVSFGWTESCRFFTSTFFAIVITSLWNYSYSLFIHMQRFFNPLPPSPPVRDNLSVSLINTFYHKYKYRNKSTSCKYKYSWITQLVSF